MSVLIKGMEMPTKENVVILINPQGGVWMIGDMPNEDTHLVKAKAVPVPPHGRLIDADALHEELYALEYARENEWFDGVREAQGVDAARVALLDAPTIIPAEEGET